MADINKISPLPYTTPIVDSNGVLNQQAQQFFEILSQRATIIGQGSPEGIVEALVGASYIDTLGSTGTIKWIKLQNDIGGDMKFGWTLE